MNAIRNLRPAVDPEVSRLTEMANIERQEKETALIERDNALGRIRHLEESTHIIAVPHRRIRLANGPDFVQDLIRPAGSPARPIKRLFPT